MVDSNSMARQFKQILALADIDRLFENEMDSFVAACYRQLLRREPDSSGFQYYEDRLAEGHPKSEVILDILSSEEARRKVRNVREARYYVRFRFLWRMFPRLFVSGTRRMTLELVRKVDLLTELAGRDRTEEAVSENSEGHTQRRLQYAVRVRGGLGDALVVARYLRDLQRGFDDSVSFDVYFHSPLLVKFVFEGLQGFRQ